REENKARHLALLLIPDLRPPLLRSARSHSTTRHLAIAEAAAFGAQARSAAGFAGLFVIFATTHFFLDAASLHQFAEPANCFLNGLPIANVQLNHRCSFAA